ncbi:hypothetical protein [Caloranaerobacter sp. TR13]|uniref:hypothetical protein n=1 Tax=Caloranaerobacter sp. TR13 TaxID=1302151 RepID=UPI0013792A02|nr:hypothetical protein [Caloranaerobacter sp. TR13]
MHWAGGRAQGTEIRGQRSGDREQKTRIRRLKIENVKNRDQKSGDREQDTESRD